MRARRTLRASSLDAIAMLRSLFRAREALVPLTLTAGLIASGLAVGAHAAEVSGTAALTSDYVWRGSSQTLEDPAAQVGIKLASSSGVYASAWGSNVRFAGPSEAHTEFDLTAGWSHAFNDDWSLDANVLRYVYPSTTVDLDWTELNATLAWRDRAWVGVGASNDALALGKRGVYTQLGGRVPINDRFRFEGVVAHYALDSRVAPDYTHAQVNAVWVLHKPFELRLSAHATDEHARALFGDKVAGSRIEAALQTTF